MGGWRKWHEAVVGGRSGVLSSVVRGGLDIASRVYGAGVYLRNRSFDRDKRDVCTAEAPVISVGNLTAGGTGKTPMVIEIASRLLSMGRKPAVLSRGYKSDAEGKSDEVTMMQQALPELQCVVDSNRVAGAIAAVQGGADVLLLDDGFQHRRLARDLDIVLIDATRPFGYGHLLPRGFLREPVENASRADALVLTRANEVPDHRRVELLRLLAKLAPKAVLLSSTHRVDGFVDLAGEGRKAKALPPALLVSGIGNPDSFERTIESLGVEVVGHLRFGDHHAYGDADAAAIRQQAMQLGAASILTTAKDAPKLSTLKADWPVPVLVCNVSIALDDESSARLDQLLTTAIERKARRV